jgi:predicted N-acetyltransferase YhbS
MAEQIAVEIRPLAAADVEQAWEMSHTSLQTAGLEYGWHMPDADALLRSRGHERIRHLMTHDPEGTWVAELDGVIVGVAAATRRGPLWFLSLLTVATSVQSRGVGRQLLEASMRTLGPAGAICASDDPKALRRYRVAGFELQPRYEAKGPVERAAIPAVDGVRPGSYDNDRDFVDDIATGLRNAPHGVDLDFFAATGRPLYVMDTSAGRGYVACTEKGVAVLGATTAAAARSLLWTALAECTDQDVSILWLRHDQSWAIDVALEARLSLRPTGSFCTRGAVGPMSPYIPNGAFG